jgi:acyl-CoA synthetase (AMP-forming)/AMP-acid ligase II
MEDETIPTNCVGRPIIGVSLEIRDEHGVPVEPGIVGEIWVTGQNIMLGYYNEPEKTKEVVKNGWLDTGDLGYIDPKGRLVITGRLKDLIVSKGFNVYPQEIENVILMHPSVIRVGVIGEVDPMSGENAIAYVQVRHMEPDIEQKLKVLCTQNLAAYKIPRKFICVTYNLPTTATGKVDKKVLRKKLAEGTK